MPKRRSLSETERRLRDTAHIADLPAAGHRIRLYQWGDGGPTTLLVHGWGGGATQFEAVVHRLVASGHRVVAFDLPGHGQSTGSFTDLGQMAQVIAAVVRLVGPVDSVVAHSLGAAATGIALADGLQVSRVALLAAAAEPHVFFGMFARWLRLPEVVQAEAQRLIHQRVGRPFAELTLECTLPADLDALLLVHDRGDRRTPYAPIAGVAAQRPRARLMSTEGLGHRRILEDDNVVDAVASFAVGLHDLADGAQPMMQPA
ncbi:MAG: alpha/beta fold hydrolase [Nannocystales bacterium]